VILAFSAFLRHRILGPALVCLAPVTNEIEDAVGWRWQGGDEVLSHPTDEQVDVPIGGFEEPRKAPSSDGSGCPPGHLLQGFASRIKGLHENEPAEHEPMVAFPNTGQALEIDGDESGQIGEGYHHSRSIPERVTLKSDDGGRHHVAFVAFGFDFTRFLPLGCRF
jgi:hypothetical protein